MIHFSVHIFWNTFPPLSLTKVCMVVRSRQQTFTADGYYCVYIRQSQRATYSSHHTSGLTTSCQVVTSKATLQTYSLIFTETNRPKPMGKLCDVCMCARWLTHKKYLSLSQWFGGTKLGKNRAKLASLLERFAFWYFSQTFTVLPKPTHTNAIR